MSIPSTAELIEAIRQRDGQVGPGNAPEEWVTLCRTLERENAALKVRLETTELEYYRARGTAWELMMRRAKAEGELDSLRAGL